jgi:hypothetical protein
MKGLDWKRLITCSLINAAITAITYFGGIQILIRYFFSGTV